MRFLVSAKMEKDVLEWCRSNVSSTFNTWFPFFSLKDGSPAILFRIEDPLICLTFVLLWREYIEIL